MALLLTGHNTDNQICVLISVISLVAYLGRKEEASPPSRNPGKFANDEEQPRPQAAIRIDSSRKLKLSLKLSKII